MIKSNNIPTYNDINENTNNKVIIKTNLHPDKLEETINKILDNYQDKCKYYINLTDAHYTVSFKGGLEAHEPIFNTTFYLYLYKRDNNKSIVCMYNEKENHTEWKDVKKDIITTLHYLS